MDRLVTPAFAPEELRRLLKTSLPVQEGSALIRHILTDSRSLLSPSDTLFIAITTDSGDGHRYIPQLYARGVRSFVVEHLPEQVTKGEWSGNWYVVPSSVRALQCIASAHRARFPQLQCIGITGSNGKTIVKELLYQLLEPTRAVVRSPRSYNSQIGVPLSVLGIEATDELAILEAGISQPHEMAPLREVIQPSIGLFTCLGSAHQENFVSLEEKLREKLQLFTACHTTVYGVDDPLVARLMREACPEGEHLTWSRKDRTATLYVEREEARGDKTNLQLRALGKDYQLTLPFTDAGYVEDCLVALTLITQLAPELLSQPERWEGLHSVAMRLEVKDGIAGNTLINDSYSCDLQSLSIALDFLRRRATATAMRPVLLLSDIEGSGLGDQVLYGEVASLIRSYGVQELIAVGEHISSQLEGLEGVQVITFPTTQALLGSQVLSQIQGSCLLIKGARRFAFEEVYRRLSIQEHQTVLDIDLQAVVHNLNHYRALLPPQHPIICMIKADGYGTGAFELARTLQEHRVEYLAVAVADEGRELREKGIRTHLMIMNPELRSAETLFAHMLEPEVYSFQLLEGLRAKARALGVQDFPIHIKVDSGMHRLGFDYEDMERLGRELATCSELRVCTVFSHLATADEETKADYVHHQYEQFIQSCDALERTLGYRPRRHLLNTAGIERYPQYALDMARLGIGLYGFSPTARAGVEPIARFSTVILQVKDLKAGEYIGYGCRGQLSRDSRVAVLPVGYADGFSRRLSRGAYAVMIRGHLCPTIGNVCMDACMVDVTDVPGVLVGDEAILFGCEGLPLEGVAEVCDTIPYEILTGISSRVQRRYWRE